MSDASRISADSPAVLPRWPDAWLLEAVRRAGIQLDESLLPVSARSAWEAVVAAGVADEDVLEAASRSSTAPRADLSALDPVASGLLAAGTALRFGVVPVEMRGGRLDVATSNPLASGIEETLSFATGRPVRMLVAPPGAIRAALARVYPTAESAPAPVPLLAGIGPVEERIFAEALGSDASDIHIEPLNGGLLVRMRVDGVLHDAMRIPAETAAPLISRIKVAAGLDIADRLRPQDGRSTIVHEGARIDLRVSTLPLGNRVEKVVIRLLDSRRATVPLEALGFTPGDLYRIGRVLNQREGMLLVTGPTGSGKTSTLYSSVSRIRSTAKNLITVEDPIEYHLEGINQVQVREKAGLTFASALRSILRQDPDVILVGEIRDAETAGIAVKAAMTGHLLLSTLHTNDAPSAVGRLLDIGVDPGALGVALKGIIAQRLVRRLCGDCSQPTTLAELPLDQQMLLMGKKTDGLRRAVGCPSCRNTGYRGRVVVPEVLLVSDEMQRAITNRAGVSEITEIARAAGMLTLWEAGLERVLAGVISLHELIDNIVAPVPDNAAAQADVDSLLSQLLGNGPAAAAAAAAPPNAAPVAGRQDGRSDAAPPRTGSPAAGGALRALIVDDDRESRQALRAVLETEGIRVIEAADGEAARAYATRLRPDLVITELPLPRLDGIGLLQALAAGEHPVRVVVYTTQTDESLLDWARDLGAEDVVPRSIDARVLVARLRTACVHAA